PPQPLGNEPVVRTKVEGDGEGASRRRQPLHQVVRDPRQQEFMLTDARSRPVAPPDEQGAVEDVIGCRHGSVIPGCGRGSQRPASPGAGGTGGVPVTNVPMTSSVCGEGP